MRARDGISPRRPQRRAGRARSERAFRWGNPVRDRLERLVAEMVERGILFEDALHAFERTFIVRVLERTDGNLSEAARELRIHRNTLSRQDRRTQAEEVAPPPLLASLRHLHRLARL